MNIRNTHKNSIHFFRNNKSGYFIILLCFLTAVRLSQAMFFATYFMTMLYDKMSYM